MSKAIESYEFLVATTAEGIYKVGNSFSNSLHFSKMYLGRNYNLLMKEAGKTEEQLHKDVIRAVNSYVISNLDSLQHGSQIHKINKLALG
ncbi:hypothetical protein [Phage f2b1]|nr:hypothetical protein [Phage f2b1]